MRLQPLVIVIYCYLKLSVAHVIVKCPASATPTYLRCPSSGQEANRDKIVCFYWSSLNTDCKCCVLNPGAWFIQHLDTCYTILLKKYLIPKLYTTVNQRSWPTITARCNLSQTWQTSRHKETLSLLMLLAWHPIGLITWWYKGTNYFAYFHKYSFALVPSVYKGLWVCLVNYKRNTSGIVRKGSNVHLISNYIILFPNYIRWARVTLWMFY